jgi:tetratricopeptide (TPR) repeat protein
MPQHSSRAFVLTLAFIVICLILARVDRATGESPRRRTQPVPAKSAQTYFNMAKKQFDRGRYARAARLLSASIRRGGDPSAAYMMRGQAFDRIGIPRKAIQDFSRFIKINPSDPRGYTVRGDVQMFNHNYEAALKDYNEAIRVSPSHRDAYVSRGLAKMGLGRYREAIKDYQWVLKDNPSNSEVLVNMGRAYMLARQPVVAVNYLEKALEQEGNLKWRRQIEEWIEELLQEPRVKKSRAHRPVRGPRRVPARPLW